MYKKLIGFVLATLVASSASAAIVKYEMKDVIGSGGSTLTGHFYQSTTDSRILYYGLDFKSPTAFMQFSNFIYPIEGAHNYFGGDGPTSFRATSNSGDYFKFLDLVFLPGTGQDVVVRGSAIQIPNEPWLNTRSSYAIQYGTVTSSIVTDPTILAFLAPYATSEMVPVISQAIPVEVPEPESLPLLMVAGAAAFAASKRRKAA